MWNRFLFPQDCPIIPEREREREKEKERERERERKKEKERERERGEPIRNPRPPSPEAVNSGRPSQKFCRYADHGPQF